MFRILAPLDGDVLSDKDGSFNPEGFKTTSTIEAPEGVEIYVNGIPAFYKDGVYKCDVQLKAYSNNIYIEERNTGLAENINVFVLKDYQGRYRLSIDDCIWTFRDIAQHSPAYNSIFESPFMAFLKKIHDSYGTKIHINAFYETDGFNLSQMPDKYKSEWQSNANWLTLSFHAFSNDPMNPYKDADYEKVKHDCKMVKDELKRFAGEEVLEPVTTLHWGTATTDGCRALKDMGYQCLIGYFTFINGVPCVSYYFDTEQINHISKRFIWRDNNAGIIFQKSSITIDQHKLNEICPYLDKVTKDVQDIAYVDLLVHEQYFYHFYPYYQSDYTEKVLEAIEWASDNGYKPASLAECIQEE